MRRDLQLSTWLTLPLALVLALNAFGEYSLKLYVVDLHEQPLEGVRLSVKGFGGPSPVTTADGKTRLPLPPTIQPGRSVFLAIVDVAGVKAEHVFISPYDGRAVLPTEQEAPNDFFPIMLARKGVRENLQNDRFVRSIVEKIEGQPVSKDAGDGSARQDALLKSQAAEFGFTAEEVHEAVKSWSARVKDPYEQGLAKLYAKDYVDAEQCLSASLKMREDQLQRATTEAGDAAFFLAKGRYEQGHYRESAETYQKALQYRPEDSTVLNNLAVALVDGGEFQKAEALYRQAIEIDKKTIGEEHAGYATRLNNLADLYREQAKYAEAEPLYKQAMEIDEKALGEEHPGYAINLNNLAVLYKEQAKYAEAEPLFKQAIEIGKKTIGEEHPSYAIRLNNLATVYNDQGKYAEAEPLHKQAMEIVKKALGEEHPSYAISLNNLATVYDAQGKYVEAEPLYKQAIEIDKKALGEEHPGYAIDLSNLAGLYKAQEKYAEAEPLYKQAMEIVKRALGEEHPGYAVALHNLAELYRTQGRKQEAVALYSQALRVFEKALPAGHSNISTTANNYAALLRELGRDAEAEAALKHVTARGDTSKKE